MPNPPDYDQIEMDAWRYEADNVITRLDSNDFHLYEQIVTYSYRFGYSTQDVENRIRSDVMFASHFAKVPRRMNIFANAAADWIENLLGVRQFRRLPPAGRYAFYINRGGEVVQGMRTPPTKSLDFRWETGEYSFFTTHKFIGEPGGGQVGSFRQVRRAMELFQKAGAENNIVFLAITDGPYFNESRLDELNRFARLHEPKSFALSIDRLPRLLEEYW